MEHSILDIERSPIFSPRMVPWKVAGQTVRVLWDHVADAGKHQVQWDGTDDLGRSMASGLYLVRLEAEGILRVQKIVLTK